jgi:NifU-like protein involved in Fe-S cluster formation
MNYSLEVQQRFRLPPGAGEFSERTPGVAASEAADKTLNVWVRVQIEFVGTVIRTVRFNVFGCPHIVAAASWVAESLHGCDTTALGELDMRDVGRRLDVPLEKLGKLLVLEDALRGCMPSDAMKPGKNRS